MLFLAEFKPSARRISVNLPPAANFQIWPKIYSMPAWGLDTIKHDILFEKLEHYGIRIFSFETA